MTDFATDRLEPTSRGVPVSGQEPRDLPGKPSGRPKAKPRSPEASDPDKELVEQNEQPSHRVDQMA